MMIDLTSGTSQIPMIKILKLSTSEKNKSCFTLFIMDKLYTVPFKIRSYEVDHNERSTLSSICNYFQEAAGIHAHHLNFDISQLHAKGLTWVLYKMHVIVDQRPKRWEDIDITTWPTAGDGLRAFRDYEMKSKNGEILARAVSQWMVLDLKTKRPVRTPAEISKMGLTNRSHAVEPNKKQLETVTENKSVLITKVNDNDLDMNNHVNNVRYIDWMTGYLPNSLVDGKQCQEMEIQYLSESVKGDEIYLSYEQKADTIQQTLFKNSDRKAIATSLSKWQ
ncbi:acyl-[acyl-carrier-protein] thioesterase [Rhodohalobacter barkolensis]|uniref:Acyl-[acyl-carrier-protein] thioesterase n=2 Tax=Rhodohalobacter barkolensis TaxID=2053187 RepID=A0A2N0VJL0_9BACT|nr:acyl-[acyl-carrier-protein] thioesterase [Rhodohalobacter barkolensis]